MFLVTAMVTGQLTALLRAQVEQAGQREREAAALAEASWAVASQLNRDRALTEVLRRLTSVIGLRAAAILVQGETEVPAVIATGGEQGQELPEFASGIAREAVEYVL